MNVDLLVALARLRTNDLLGEAATRRAILRDRPPPPSIRARAGWALRSLGAIAISLGDALAPRVL